MGSRSTHAASLINTSAFLIVYNGGEGGIRNITSRQISNELNEHGPIEAIDPIESGGAGMKLD